MKMGTYKTRHNLNSYINYCHDWSSGIRHTVWYTTNILEKPATFIFWAEE
jgi:hypothetical protein